LVLSKFVSFINAPSSVLPIRLRSCKSHCLRSRFDPPVGKRNGCKPLSYHTEVRKCQQYDKYQITKAKSMCNLC
jgi:hypothetical protein